MPSLKQMIYSAGRTFLFKALVICNNPRHKKRHPRVPLTLQENFLHKHFTLELYLPHKLPE